MSLLDITGVIFDPRFWSRYPVSHALSDRLEELMDEGAEVRIIDMHTATIGHLEIWLAESTGFFAFGGLYPREGNRMVPRRRTALRLENYILERRLRA